MNVMPTLATMFCCAEMRERLRRDATASEMYAEHTEHDAKP